MPKVAAEPNTSPHRRLMTPSDAMDMVSSGRWAYSRYISSVAESRVSTSALFWGITATFRMSAPISCIFRSR